MIKLHLKIVLKMGLIFLFSIFLTVTIYTLTRMAWETVPLLVIIPVLIYDIVDSITPSFISTETVMIFCLFATIHYLLIHRYIRSFVKIDHAVSQMAKGNFEQRVEVKGRHELSELALRINQLVEKLEQTVKEERIAEQSKNELITNVSHDLRTPLTSVMGYLDLIERDQYKDEVELRYYTEVAYEKTQHINRLVNDLFEYIRTKNPKLHLDIQPVDAKIMLKQLAAHFYVQLTQAEIDCTLHLPDEDIRMRADSEKLARVFENILSNAIKYGAEGRRIDITLRSTQQNVEIEIRNYGEPISPMELPHIFDRFYRLEQSRSIDTGGSGLGLAIAKNLVELHGGSIHVQSDEAGTAFTVRLPAASTLKT